MPLARELTDLPVVRHRRLLHYAGTTLSPGLRHSVTVSAVSSWLPLPAGPGYGVDNLPYGVVGGRVIVPLGDGLRHLERTLATLAPDLSRLVATPSLDPLLAAGPDSWAAVRGRCGGCSPRTPPSTARGRAPPAPARPA